MAWLLAQPGLHPKRDLALTLGIGTATAVFSAVDRILFRSLPYPDEKSLVSIGMTAPLDTNEFVLATDWPDWRNSGAPFEFMTTLAPGNRPCDLTDENPVRLQCAAVESTFLKTLGIRPLLGRDFIADDDRPNAPKAVVISYGFWQGRFGGDRSVLEQTISLDGEPVRVVGVLPRHFEMPTLVRADLLLPQALDFRRMALLRAFGRLKPGVTVPQAETALRPVFEESLKRVPEAFRAEVKLRVRGLRDRQLQDVRLAAWLLFGSVIAVLLIACANVGNLLLARAAVRQREFALRAAIGAVRSRLVRQNLTESLLLGVFGCAPGALLAWIILATAVRMAPRGIPHLEQATLDVRVLLFCVTVSIFSAIIFGLAPSTCIATSEALQARGIAGRRWSFGHWLVAAQVAVSLTLLTGSGLLTQSLLNLESVPLGMRTESILTAPIVLSQRYGSPEERRLFFEQLEARLQSVPGLEDAALSDSVPLAGGVSDTNAQNGTRSILYAAIEVEGRPRPPEGTGGLVAWRIVTPNYFQVLEIPILRGRSFIDSDRNPDQQVVIISEALASRLFPNEEVLGKSMRWGYQGPWRTIVGVAANVKNNPELAGSDDPEYYTPRKRGVAEGISRQASIILRTTLDPRSVSSSVRRAVAALDPTLPVNIELMSRRVAELADRPRFIALLLGLFATIAVLLVATGLYGVISFLVVQRTQEVGIRMALGATSRNILKLVLSHALRWTIGGVIVGLGGTLVVTRLARTLLFQVSERDPWTFCLAIAVLVLIAMLAAWLPSRRASQTDPMVALRRE